MNCKFPTRPSLRSPWPSPLPEGRGTWRARHTIVIELSKITCSSSHELLWSCQHNTPEPGNIMSSPVDSSDPSNGHVTSYRDTFSRTLNFITDHSVSPHHSWLRVTTALDTYHEIGNSLVDLQKSKKELVLLFSQFGLDHQYKWNTRLLASLHSSIRDSNDSQIWV